MTRLRSIITRIDPIDFIAVASTAVLAVGLALVFVPAAFVAVGGLGLAYAIAASRAAPPPEGGES